MRILATSSPTPKATPEALQRTMQEEIALGRRYYEDGLVQQAYMDPSYARAFMILEAESVDAARAALERYPQVAEGLIAFELTPLVGLPAVAQVHEARGTPLPAWWPPTPSSAPSTAETPDGNAARARTFVERVLAQGDMAAFDALVAEDVVVHSGIRPLAPIRGKGAFREALGALAAFSDGALELQDVVAAGDRVAVRYRATATHTGPQLGVPATGKRIVMWELRLMRFRDGRLVEDFVADINYDWPWLVAPAYRDAWLAALPAGGAR